MTHPACGGAQTHALIMTLCKKGVFGVDELRRGIEALPAEAYRSLSYYEKWARSAAASLTDQGVLTLPEIEAALGHEEEVDPPVKCAQTLIRTLIRHHTPRLKTPNTALPQNP